jgi:preprotein translocase subunit SecE
MMPDKNARDKRIDKRSESNPNALKKSFAFVAKSGKRLKSFFINMKAELKRVVWPDRKKLIQNTATVLALCLLAGTILFVIDFSLGKILEGIGFYAPSAPTTTTTAATTTTTVTTSASETTIEITTAAPTTQSAAN